MSIPVFKTTPKHIAGSQRLIWDSEAGGQRILEAASLTVSIAALFWFGYRVGAHHEVHLVALLFAMFSVATTCWLTMRTQPALVPAPVVADYSEKRLLGQWPQRPSAHGAETPAEAVGSQR